MSEKILQALMQLFAIVANVKDISKNSRAIVQDFLDQQLNQELVEEYLTYFDEFLAKQNTSKDGKIRQKKTSVNSVKVLKICTEINEELNQKQKVIVLIRLLEFIYTERKEAGAQELEFVETVHDVFNIEKEEFKEAERFIKSDESVKIDSESVLVIRNNQPTGLKKSKFIQSSGIEGEARIVRIKSVNLMFVRYLGDAELYLNGQILNQGRTYILNQGSSIRSAKVQPIYYSDILSSFLTDDNKEKIVFQVKDLEYVFKGGNIGLHPLSFTEESGKLFGIMGASGAGKSTLLNILNGNYKPTKGEVSINGIDIHSEKQMIEGVIGFVSQDDLLIEELTVYQNLYYNAKLCFDNYSEHELNNLVTNTLNSLGLIETRDLKVGSPLEKTISGGQRKRLNIALELIREPAVMFVDEPTSGLSSRDSQNIMDLLKELSLKGKIIFVVIHQPSSDIFKMFDKLLILDTGGYPVYNGDPVEGINYFKRLANYANISESDTTGNVNPELIFNIIDAKVVDEFGNSTKNRKISSKEYYKKYLQNFKDNLRNNVKLSRKSPESTFKVPNAFKQFSVFITRDVLSKLTNKQYLFINLLEAPVLAFILSFLVKYHNTDTSNITGYIFRENENLPAYIFMSVIVALFIGLTVSAEEIIRDKKILKREKFLNLSKRSYLLSKVTVMFGLSAIQTLTFVMIGSWILEIKGMFLEQWIVLFSTACFANMLGLNISASFNSAVTIYILIPFLIIPQLILSGVIVKFDKLNPSITVQNKVPISGEIMASRWAFEALAVSFFKDNEFERNFYKQDQHLKSSEFKKNYWLGKMRSKVSSSLNNLEDTAAESQQKLADDLTVLRNEIKKELKQTSRAAKFTKVDNLTVDKVDNQTLKEAKEYLRSLNDYYVDLYNKYYDKKDKLITAMNSNEVQKEAFIKLKDDYTNDALADLVTDKNEFNKILEKDGVLYQKANPVYLESNQFRAHFFAPTKKVFGRKIDTFWVNVMVLWAMSLFLAITLNFDAFKRVIDGLEKLVSSISGGGRK